MGANLQQGFGVSAATPDICAQTQPALPGEAGIDQIEMKLVSGAELYEIRDVASKFADNAARLAALFQVLEQAIYTGARISELLALRWQKVHLDRGVIEIRGSMSTAKVKGEASQEKVRWFDPKTKKGERDIPIPPQLVAALKEWKEKCPQSRLDLVFSNEVGEPCDRTGIGRYGLTPALKQAKIDKAVSMHGLRHTYASMLIALGRKIPEVSQHLGHADVSIAMRVYAHFLKPQETGHHGRLGKAHRKFFGTARHSLTQKEKNIIVSS